MASPDPQNPEEFAPGKGTLKRLTDAEFRNTLRDLLGDVTIGELEPDSWSFPAYTPNLQAAMAREVPAMFQSVVFDERSAALDLFTTRRTFVNRELALLYGLDATGLTDEPWVPVELPPDELRAGLLGTAAFLSIYANPKEGSHAARKVHPRVPAVSGDP